MRVTIQTGKGHLPVFIAIPTALLAGPLSLPIARAARTFFSSTAKPWASDSLPAAQTGTQNESPSGAQVRALARGVRKSARALRRAKLPLVEIRAVNGVRIAVRL